MKIVGIGLNKTGTSTLKTCMETWGFKHVTYNLDAFNAYRERDWDYLKSVADEHDSFENWPWALMYEQFDDWYPDAKFILTVRKDAQTWFKSLSRHGQNMGPLTDFEIYIYGYAVPKEHKREHIEFYNQHNSKVKKFYENRPDKLLEVCWENGDGWKELADFLNLDAPNVPFPHSNKTPNYYQKLERKYRPILGKYKQMIFGPKNSN